MRNKKYKESSNFKRARTCHHFANSSSKKEESIRLYTGSPLLEEQVRCIAPRQKRLCTGVSRRSDACAHCLVSSSNSGQNLNHFFLFLNYSVRNLIICFAIVSEGNQCLIDLREKERREKNTMEER